MNEEPNYNELREIGKSSDYALAALSAKITKLEVKVDLLQQEVNQHKLSLEYNGCL